MTRFGIINAPPALGALLGHRTGAWQRLSQWAAFEARPIPRGRAGGLGGGCQQWSNPGELHAATGFLHNQQSRL